MRTYGWPCLAAAGAALVIQGVVALFLERRLANDAESLAYMKGEVAKVGRGIEDLRDFRKKGLTSTQTCHMVSSAMSAQRNLPTRILDELARIRPDGMRFTIVDQQGATVDIKGEASSDIAIAELVKRVEASELLEQPRLRAVADPLTFDVGMRIRRRPQ